MNVYLSPFKNPYINLALEDYFLRTAKNLPLLFFYVNRPSVVMGRFQNPWLECNLAFLAQNDIWPVRRQSGGGCVYHDDGNLNFSFIVPGNMIDRQKHALILQNAFQKVDIELKISPRNDLWLKDSEGEWKKISGSAYKQTKEASFHHGTFLVHSDLEKLNESLKHTLIPKSTHSIASVRSKVISLHMKHPGVEIPDVIELVAHHLKVVPIMLDGSLLSIPEVQASFSHLTGDDWLWGETPRFEMETSQGTLSVRKGTIEDSGKKFDRQLLEGLVSEELLNRMFPDFSELRKLSNQIL